MDFSKSVIEFIKQREGFEQNAKVNTSGVAFIGYGTTSYKDGTPVKLGDKCNTDMAEIWLLSDVMEIIEKINSLKHLDVNNFQFDALVDFVYSEGFDVFKRSLLYRKILDNPADKTIFNYSKEKPINSCEFLRFIYCGGKLVQKLVERRIYECNLYSN